MLPAAQSLERDGRHHHMIIQHQGISSHNGDLHLITHPVAPFTNINFNPSMDK